MSLNKIVPFQTLGDYRGGVLCHGCFDLVHVGHIRYLRWARHLRNDVPLVVTLTDDAHFPDYKGEGRPAFDELTRAEWVAAIGVVDAVSIVCAWTAVPAIEQMRPSVYAKGREAEGMIPHEESAARSVGAEVCFMPRDHEMYAQRYASGRILSGQYMRERIIEQRTERGQYADC